MKKTLRPAQIARLGLNELERRIPISLELLQKLEADLQLGSRIKHDGSTMSDEEYTSWRARCSAALQFQVREYRNLKEARHKLTSGSESPVRLLQAAIGILRGIKELSPEDLLVCHRIEVWLAPRISRSAPRSTGNSP